MPNALASETSPYLLQHAHNPVHWQPWGEAALAQAHLEGKLILVSIGYSACHWCHVMERESFEDPQVAEVMNQFFVCIKVDREERPDVDQVYMDAVQLMRGQGGWPLNCFCLPDGRPIFGGTYFPRQQWLEILYNLEAFIRRDPAKAAEYATELTEAIQQMDALGKAGVEDNPITTSAVDALYLQIAQRFDLQHGGAGQAPKFPVPSTWHLALAYGHTRKYQPALLALTLTLDKMAAGGLYDHLGGGFARYSTDALWHVPHFEKMLYDNSQLVSLYSKAYRKTQSPRYLEVIEQTIGFVERELMSPEGGFYSALDADSESVEGKFYVWSENEVDTLLGADAALFKAAYSITSAGNWEHTNILLRSQSDAQLAEAFALDTETVYQKLAAARQVLFNARAPRVRPGLDNKILAGWNGLMAEGLCQAYLATGHHAYLALAQTNDTFVERHLAAGPALIRTASRTTAGTYTAALDGLLEDYAANISALVLLYQCTFDESYLQRAAHRLDYVLQHFADTETPLLYFTPADAAPLIARRKEYYDSVLPSSNALIAHALHTLGQLLDRPEWSARAQAMLLALWPHIQHHPGSHAHWVHLALRIAHGDAEIAIVGPDATRLRNELTTHYLGEALLLGGTTEGTLPLLAGKLKPGETVIYVCRNKTCQRPTALAAEAWKEVL